MASELEQAKRAVRESESDETELDLALEAGRDKLALTRENNRYKEATQERDLGYFGKVLGGPNQAPLTIAFLIAALSLIALIICTVLTVVRPNSSTLLDKAFTAFLTLCSSSFSYIAGTRTGGKSK